MTIVKRRDPAKLGGFLMTIVNGRDPAKLGGFLMTIDMNYTIIYSAIKDLSDAFEESVRLSF